MNRRWGWFRDGRSNALKARLREAQLLHDFVGKPVNGVVILNNMVPERQVGIVKVHSLLHPVATGLVELGSRWLALLGICVVSNLHQVTRTYQAL